MGGSILGLSCLFRSLAHCGLRRSRSIFKSAGGQLEASAKREWHGVNRCLRDFASFIDRNGLQPLSFKETRCLGRKKYKMSASLNRKQITTVPPAWNYIDASLCFGKPPCTASCTLLER